MYPRDGLELLLSVNQAEHELQTMAKASYPGWLHEDGTVNQMGKSLRTDLEIRISKYGVRGIENKSNKVKWDISSQSWFGEP